jgi:HptB-dependent secretion and biofilm anti anti-sigma factor
MAHISVSSHDDDGLICLYGCFDGSSSADFRQGYEGLLACPGLRYLTVDLSHVDHLDRIALGMLLLLRQRAKSVDKGVLLRYPRGWGAQVLEHANFHHLFELMK